MKIADQDGKPAFAPGWTSRDIASPLPPLVVNGVLFAAASGTRTVPAVLYALDAATGKDLWNSGKTVTSQLRGGLAAGQGTLPARRRQSLTRSASTSRSSNGGWRRRGAGPDGLAPLCCTDSSPPVNGQATRLMSSDQRSSALRCARCPAWAPG